MFNLRTEIKKNSFFVGTLSKFFDLVAEVAEVYPGEWSRSGGDRAGHAADVAGPAPHRGAQLRPFRSRGNEGRMPDAHRRGARWVAGRRTVRLGPAGLDRTDDWHARQDLRRRLRREHRTFRRRQFFTGQADENGLDEMDKRILEAVIIKFGGGPVGVSSLAVADRKSVV